MNERYVIRTFRSISTKYRFFKTATFSDIKKIFTDSKNFEIFSKILNLLSDFPKFEKRKTAIRHPKGLGSYINPFLFEKPITNEEKAKYEKYKEWEKHRKLEKIYIRDPIDWYSLDSTKFYPKK